MFHHNRTTKVEAGVHDKMGGPLAHPDADKHSVVDPETKLGPCAKKVVKATLVCLDGSRFVGTNDCRYPQEICPRQPGEDYAKCAQICGQPGHAERMAIKAAGVKATGGTMYIEGIDWVCEDCQRAMRDCQIHWHLAAPSTWIEIAYRNRHSAGPVLRWVPLPDSPYSIDEAHELYNSGWYDMATRNEPDRAVLVIRKRQKRDPVRRQMF